MAARIQCEIRVETVSSLTWPATILRGRCKRAWICPCSRSPCAAWLRFMKSISMVSQGRAELAWVCRCKIGTCSALRPAIHIFAGEKVCIQTMTPTHFGLEEASKQIALMLSGVVRTGFQVALIGMFVAALRVVTTSCDCFATCAKVSSP